MIRNADNRYGVKISPPYVVGTTNCWVQGCYELVPYFTRVPAIQNRRNKIFRRLKKLIDEEEG